MVTHLSKIDQLVAQHPIHWLSIDNSSCIFSHRNYSDNVMQRASARFRLTFHKIFCQAGPNPITSAPGIICIVPAHGSRHVNCHCCVASPQSLLGANVPCQTLMSECHVSGRVVLAIVYHDWLDKTCARDVLLDFRLVLIFFPASDGLVSFRIPNEHMACVCELDPPFLLLLGHSISSRFQLGDFLDVSFFTSLLVMLSRAKRRILG